jgi:hypothetical protein
MTLLFLMWRDQLLSNKLVRKKPTRELSTYTHRTYLSKLLRTFKTARVLRKTMPLTSSSIHKSFQALLIVESTYAMNVLCILHPQTVYGNYLTKG